MTAIKEREADSKQCKSLSYFKTLTLFADLPEKDIERFADAAQIKNYKKGQFLYLEGAQADFFLCYL